MYLLSAAGNFDCRVSLDKEGPIHDVAWAPNSKEFGVVYGCKLTFVLTLSFARLFSRQTCPLRLRYLINVSGRFTILGRRPITLFRSTPKVASSSSPDLATLLGRSMSLTDARSLRSARSMRPTHPTVLGLLTDASF